MLLHRLEALGRALHAEAVDVPFEVVVVHLEQLGGDHLCLRLDLSARHGGCCAGDRGRARAVGAEAVGRGIGVPLLDDDVVGGEPKLAGDDLGVGRLVPLPLADLVPRRAMPVPVGWMRISAESNIAMPRMSQSSRSGADDLGEEGDADAQQPAGLATLEGFLRSPSARRAAPCSPLR